MQDLAELSIQLYFTGTTLISVFFFFKIQVLKEILIGDGQSLHTRQQERLKEKEEEEKKNGKVEKGEKKTNDRCEDYKPVLITNKYRKRLRDAIFRKNIYGVEEGIINIRDCEIKKGLNDKTIVRNHVYPKFLGTKKIFETLVISFAVSTTLAFIGIFINLFILLLDVDINEITSCYHCIIGYVNPTLLVLYILSIFWIILYSIFKKTPHELDKIREVKKNR
ncbi:MAG: hypothetical protein K9I94_03735 [Bacteroidales bacterium]|nr:hypothetical protein [Bacteroidales bacterium]